MAGAAREIDAGIDDRAGIGAAFVQSDDFYDARFSDAQWDARTAAQKVKGVIDWRRLRSDALEPLLAGKDGALASVFDFERISAPMGRNPLSEAFVERQPADVIIVDGRIHRG